MNGELLERQYRNHLSCYMSWNQLPHAEEWVLFEKNIGPYVGIDEVSLSQGKLYTILINKEKKRTFGKHHRNHKGYGCQDCHIRPVEILQTQTFPGQGDNPGHGSEHGTDGTYLLPGRTPCDGPFSRAEAGL